MMEGPLVNFCICRPMKRVILCRAWPLWTDHDFMEYFLFEIISGSIVFKISSIIGARESHFVGPLTVRLSSSLCGSTQIQIP